MSLESARGWRVNGQDFSTLQCELLAGLEPITDSGGPCGRTSPAPFQVTADETLRRWLRQWQVWPESTFHPAGGATRARPSGKTGWSSGPCWTRNGSEWRSGAAACSLSRILEIGPVDARFFLSPKACEGILRRAEKRGKTLPVALQAALQAVVSPEPTKPAADMCNLFGDL